MFNQIIKQINSSDWDCSKADTQYLTHSIHRYSGKFIPQIARQAINILTNKGDLILDPYCGSGTTLLECLLLDRRSIGIDLNPLATLISQVKTTPIKKGVLNEFIKDIEDKAIKCSFSLQLALFSTRKDGDSLKEQIYSDPRWSDPWYKKWFKESNLYELIGINQIINSYPNEGCKNLALVAFSDILRRCSNASSSYPNVMFDKKKSKAPSAIPLFINRLKEIANDVAELEIVLKNKPKPEIITSNARKMPVESGSIDAIITHPPYVASIPYAEYGVLSLTWLGYDPRKLDKELTGGRRHSKNVATEFKEGFKEMIEESYRVLKKNGKFFMLLGNPVINRERVDIVQMAIDLAKKAGFKILTKTQRDGINRRANLMGSESLLFFYK